VSFEDSGFHQLPDELLDEEGVSTRLVDDELLDRRRKLQRKQPVEHLLRGLGLQRLEPDRRCVPPPRAPVRPAAEQLGPRGREHDHPGSGVPEDALERVQEIVLRPVEILDEQNERPFRADLLDEPDDGLVQPLASIERM
jgi:hypothetical protein